MINIKLKKNGMVDIHKSIIGKEGESLQETIEVEFEKEFINGTCRLNYENANGENFLLMTKEGEKYTLPVKSPLTDVEGQINMQIVITQSENENGVPIYKSNVFYMVCNKSINADVEGEEYIPLIDIITEKIAEVDNIDMDATKEGSTATITITDKEGQTKEITISDGTGIRLLPNAESCVEIGDAYIDQTTGHIQILSSLNPKTFTDGGEIKGPAGVDGFSPIANVSKVGKVATITITDKDGTTTAQVNDGEEQDLTDYVKNTDYATQDVGGVVKITNSYGTEFANDKKLRATIVDYANYNGMHNNAFIGKRTLENIITGKGLIKNTDYATQDNAGVIKISNGYGSELSTDKKLRATAVNYDDYGSLHNNAFIGKATLENAITGKELVNQTQLGTKQDTLVSGTNIKTINGYSVLGSGNIEIQGGGGTGNFNDLTNRPSYNGTVMSGSTNIPEVPTKTSDLTNDSGFVDSSYHDSSKQNTNDNSLETTDKTIVGSINEVNSIAKQCNRAKGYTNYQSLINELNSAGSSAYKVGQSFYIQTLNVPDLWVISVENTSQEYTYTTDAQFITDSSVSGGVQVGYYKLGQLETLKQDLTNYVTNTDFATASKGGVVRVSNSYGLQLSQGGSLYGLDKTYQEYTDGFNQILIDKGTLENVVTGKGLVSNTDYATQTTAGVFKTHTYGARVNNNGELYANSFTNWDNIKDLDNHYFVSKSILTTALGQLHIVKTTQAKYDALTTKDDTALYIIV